MAARLGQRSVPGTQIANARRATGLLQHRAVQHEDLGTRRIPHQAKRVTAPDSSVRCAQRRRGSQRREDHRDPRASHGPARLVRYRGDRLPSAGGRPEQMSVRASASWDLSLTRGVESTHPSAPPHAATAWRLRRCHAESGLDRAGRRLCAGPHMIAGGLAHEAEGRGVLERKSASRRSVIACEAMKRRSAARIGVNSRDPDHRGDVGDNRPLITDPTQGLLSR